jgi:hypothetical protein
MKSPSAAMTDGAKRQVNDSVIKERRFPNRRSKHIGDFKPPLLV